MKIHLLETELFHADKHINRHDEVNSRFSQFWERAKKIIYGY